MNTGCWAGAHLSCCRTVLRVTLGGLLPCTLCTPLLQVCNTVQPYLASFNTGICNMAGDCGAGFICRTQAGTVRLTCDSTATSLLAALKPTSATGFCQVSHCPQRLPVLGWHM